MGMYNEVFKKCPHCNGSGYLQIHQIVLGFGGFNLDNPESIARELNLDQIKELKEAVEGEWFRCENCSETFQMGGEDITNEKIKILNSITEKNEPED